MPRQGVRSASGVRAGQLIWLGLNWRKSVELQCSRASAILRPLLPEVDLAASDAQLVHQLKFLPKFAPRKFAGEEARVPIDRVQHLVRRLV